MTSNNTRTRVLCAAIGLLIPLLTTTGASADANAGPKIEAPKPDDNERVRTLFHNGEAAFVAGKYEESRAAFLDAWSIRQTYDVASSLAQVELKLQRYRDAAEHLEFCLRHFAPSESAKTLDHVQKALADAETHVAVVKVTSNRDGAEIFVDSLAVGKAPLPAVLFVEPGKRRIAARLNGDSAEQVVKAEAGAQYVAELKLSGVPALPFEINDSPASGGPPKITPVPGVASGLGEPSPATEPNGADRANQTTKYLVVGAGAVLTVVAAAVGEGYAGAARSKQSDMDRLRSQIQLEPGGRCNTLSASSTCSQLSSITDNRNSDNQMARGAFIASGVLAVGTVATFFFWPRREGNGGARVVPLFDRAGAALTVQGAF